MRRTELVAPSRPYKLRHLYVTHIDYIKRLALRYDKTQEEIVNEALGHGLEQLEQELSDGRLRN